MFRRDQSMDLRAWVLARALPVVLLGLGFWLWRMLGLPLTRLATAGIVLVAIVTAVPAGRRWAVELLARIRRPAPTQRAKIAIAIAILSTAYLILTGVEQGRDFIPKFHDEHRDMLETQIIARGRLWMPQHPMADFFETFHVLVKPVYVAAYFPGDALAYVPGVWLHLPFWVMPAVISGGAVGLMYAIMTQLIDGVAGAWSAAAAFAESLPLPVADRHAPHRHAPARAAGGVGVSSLANAPRIVGGCDRGVCGVGRDHAAAGCVVLCDSGGHRDSA